MDVRSRRLQTDFQRLLDLSRRSTLITAQPMNSTHDRYVVTYRCRGLVWLPDHATPSVTTEHRLGIYLHLDYPRLPPRLQWLTPIFHPNILPPDRNGGVCIGRWSPAESLEQLIVRIGEMVQYRNFSTTDALDKRAAAWTERNRAHLPVDRTPLVSPQPAPGLVDVSLGDPA